MDYFHEQIKLQKNIPAQIVIHTVDGYYNVPKHWHRSLELDYMIHAGTLIYLNGHDFFEKDGYLLVANSGAIHSIKATTLEYLDAISVIISYDFLKEVYPDMDQIIFDVPQDHEKALEIKSAMAHLWELHKMENDEFLYLKSNETIYHVLYLPFKYFRKDRRLAASAHTEKYIERFKGITEYINENYKENLTLESVAQYCGLSREYLARSFKKYMGSTFKQYLDCVRISNAYKLLMNTDLSVLEVALENGFNDSRTFIKAFKAVYGETPHKYRTKCQKS